MAKSASAPISFSWSDFVPNPHSASDFCATSGVTLLKPSKRLFECFRDSGSDFGDRAYRPVELNPDLVQFARKECTAIPLPPDPMDGPPFPKWRMYYVQVLWPELIKAIKGQAQSSTVTAVLQP